MDTNASPTNYDLTRQFSSLNLNTPTAPATPGFTINNAGGTFGLKSGGSIDDNNTRGPDVLNMGVTMPANGSLLVRVEAGAGGLTFGTNPITGSGNVTFVNFSAADALKLNVANTYTGVTTIGPSGEILAAVNGAIPTGSALTVNSGGILKFAQNSTVASLAGPGTVNLGATTLTVSDAPSTGVPFSGSLTGTGGVIKQGSGEWFLNGNNTTTGTLTVSSGTVTLSGIWAGDVLVSAGATFNVNGGTVVGTITRSPLITSSTTATGTVGSPFSYSIGASNSPTTYSLVGTLPIGVTFAAGMGKISGTPMQTGVFNVTMGVSNAAGSDSKSLSITINALAPTATATFNPSTIDAGQTSSLTVTVTNPNAVALTNVQFSNILPAGIALLAQTAGTCGTFSTGGGSTSINTSTGSFSVTSNALAANSSCNVVLSVRGNATGTANDSTSTITSSNALAGAAATATLTVSPAVTATQAIASKALVYGAAAASFTPVTGGGGTGALTYAIAPTLPAGLTLNSGTGAISGTPTAASALTTYTVTVTDTIGGTASATFALTVAQAMPILSWAAPSPITYGTVLSGTQLNATASYNGNPVAGTFAYTPAAGTVLSAGTQTLSVTFTPTDTTNFNSASTSVQLTVNKASQTITFGVQANQTFVPSGKFPISPGSATSGLALSYSSLTTGVCTVSGTTVTMLNAGTCTIAADQSGNANYNPAPQATQNVTIGKKTTTVTLTATPNPVAMGGPVTITATVAGDPPTGAVTFCDNATTLNASCAGGTLLCTTALVPGTTNSTATCTASFATPGTHSLGAFYAGDGNFTATATAQAQVLALLVATPAVPAPALNRYVLILLALFLGLAGCAIRPWGRS